MSGMINEGQKRCLEFFSVFYRTGIFQLYRLQLNEGEIVKTERINVSPALGALAIDVRSGK